MLNSLRVMILSLIVQPHSVQLLFILLQFKEQVANKSDREKTKSHEK